MDLCIICEHPAREHWGSGCHRNSFLRGSCDCTFVEQPSLPASASAEQYRRRADWWNTLVRIADYHIGKASFGSDRQRRLKVFRENAHSAAKQSLEMAELTEANEARERAARNTADTAAAKAAQETPAVTVSIGQRRDDSASADAAATRTTARSPEWIEPDLEGDYVGAGNDRPRGRAELMPGLDPGLAAVRFTYDAMRIDRPWATVEDRGFTWWGHRLATRVWSEPGFDDDGIEVFRLIARTRVLDGVSDSDVVTRLLDVGNGMAVTSALVHDAEARTVDYVASQWVHSDTLPWASRLFSTIVAMQAAEAHVRAGLLAPLLGAEPAYSRHPETGDREEPDEMLGLLDLISSHGRQPSTWAGEEMLDALELSRRAPVVARAVGDDSTIVLQLDDGERSGLVQVSARAPHPALGNGLLVRSSIEPREGPDATWAARMNRRELEVVNASLFLGSWVGASARPSFVTFYPNYLTGTGVGVVNVVLSAVNRAMWAASVAETDERFPTPA